MSQLLFFLSAIELSNGNHKLCKPLLEVYSCDINLYIRMCFA